MQAPEYPSLTSQQVLYEYVGAFVDELVLAGVRHVCVCPGSRSTPLALMIAAEPRLKTWMHVDERSASFFALGMAKALGEPVALVCTSGTAAANFLPAVVEAHYSRVPLLVLTADRPQELRETGAPQTIDQIRLYGVHAKWFVDMMLPEATPDALRYVRTTAARAVATAKSSPAAAVHLNFPFREPLVPVPPTMPISRQKRSANAPYVAVAAAEHPAAPATVHALASELAAAQRGLIICGPLNDPAAAFEIARLADVLGWPLLADPLSGLRCGPHERDLVLDAYDAFLRDEPFVAAHEPDVVLRFGAMPTSKQVLLLLQRFPAARQIMVDGEGWNDPTGLVAETIAANPRLLAAQLTVALAEAKPNIDPAWRDAWRCADQQAREAMRSRLAQTNAPFEGKIFAELAEILPAGATLYAGNSMPVRDLDTFFPGNERPVRFLCNRGANGIDGVISSALGASAVTDGPLVLAIGDLSFYHDMNGLLAAKLHQLNATIVLLNNDGGGIFSFLPQAAHAEHFEQLFGTPTGLDFKPAVEMYGGHFIRPATWPAFRDAVREGIGSAGLTVIEVRTDRQQNVSEHRAMWQAVSAALGGTA